MAARLLLSTCADERVAITIARALVERRLAACATRIPGAVSVYRWRGRIEEDHEVQLLVKTNAERLDAAVAAIRELHPDEEPECIALDVSGGSEGYLAWIEESLGGGG